MLKTTNFNGITINNYFASETDDEMALNMSKIIAKLINRDLETFEKKKDIRDVIAV